MRYLKDDERCQVRTLLLEAGVMLRPRGDKRTGLGR
jgi:hypothetical protein